LEFKEVITLGKENLKTKYDYGFADFRRLHYYAPCALHSFRHVLRLKGSSGYCCQHPERGVV
jgi:hypothetical protein